MSQSTPAVHGGPYSELSADAARDLRRPIAPAEVRFKVQATNHDDSRAQVIAYIDARTVIARLNLLFPRALAGGHRAGAARDAAHRHRRARRPLPDRHRP